MGQRGDPSVVASPAPSRSCPPHGARGRTKAAGQHVSFGLAVRKGLRNRWDFSKRERSSVKVCVPGHVKMLENLGLNSHNWTVLKAEQGWPFKQMTRVPTHWLWPPPSPPWPLSAFGLVTPAGMKPHLLRPPPTSGPVPHGGIPRANQWPGRQPRARLGWAQRPAPCES